MVLTIVRQLALCFVLATFSQGLRQRPKVLKPFAHSADTPRDTLVVDRSAMLESETSSDDVPRVSRSERFQDSDSSYRKSKDPSDGRSRDSSHRQSKNPPHRHTGDPSYSRQSGDQSYRKQSGDQSHSRQLRNPKKPQPKQNADLNVQPQRTGVNDGLPEFASRPREYSYRDEENLDTENRILIPSLYSQESNVNQETCSCNCENAQQVPIEPSCEWKMVFKAVQGSQRSVHEDWFAVGGINDDIEPAQGLLSDLTYRNGEILDDWNFEQIKRVKIEIFSKGVLGARFYFDATASDMESWFNPQRLIYAPVPEVKSRELAYFSIEGDASRGRRFLIDTDSSVCDGACGYLVVIDPSNYRKCDWEYYEDYPYFMWSAGESCKLWIDRG